MPFISEEELEDEFSVFGVEFSSPQIVEKLQELCVQYNLGAEKIVTEWVAFASTNKGVQMTLDSLDQLDRERLTKKGSKTPKTPARTNTIKQEYYDINTIQGGMDENEAENLYNAYSTTPSSKKGTNQQKRQLTPDNPPLKRFTNIARSPMVPFSPASFSPAGSTPSRKFSSRTNAGQVVAHFGVTDNTKWQGHGQTSSIQLYDEEYKLTTSFKYMFQKLVDKAHVLNDTIDYMAEKLQSHYQIEELSHVAVPMQEPVTVAGRICCDANGKMNAKSVLLEGSRDTSMGKYIPVDLAELKQFSLFPGQLVAMDGINNTGQKLVVNKLYEGVAQSLPEINVKTEPGSDKLSVLIAAGPFSTSDNLSYEPLNELTKTISKDKPDVCILRREISKVISVNRDRLRVDNQMTDCETGDRVVFCEKFEEQLPKTMQFGKYLARVSHFGQIDINTHFICSKCLQHGHFTSDCPNEWMCRGCNKSGHKLINCPTFFENMRQKETKDQQVKENQITEPDNIMQETTQKEHIEDITHQHNQEVNKQMDVQIFQFN
ncbi:DNA polymerase alpha subunit B [Mytilus galloprovincialis]|uniref:DNA polymerase alpha subunit B n=1 Tax=Mytilus galloprovincialis TaxID=29158 RepID=A0A8B6DP31_MYTGA|nr:DNA polymerase alpha subunit B [Mytilus galloprovincialis]